MIAKRNLSEITSDFDLRADYKYHALSKDYFIKIPSNAGTTVKLKEVLRRRYRDFQYDEDAEYKGIPTSNEYFDEIGNIISFDTVTAENHPDRLRYKVKQGYLLISSLKGAKTPPLLITEEWDDAVFSNGFYIYEVDERFNKDFIKSFLQTSAFKSILDEHLYRGIGISSYKERDFLLLEIPLLSPEKQLEIARKIEPLEKAIRHNIKSRKPFQDIVNEVMSEEFNYDLERFQAGIKKTAYKRNLLGIGKSFELRNSFKFHNPAYDEIERILERTGTYKLKKVLNLDIRLGISPEYDEAGNAYYISPAAMAKGFVDLSEAQTVSDAFFNKNKKTFSVKVNDILLRRSGVSIGKVAMVTEEMDAIFSDFMMRIRINEKNANPFFIFYYFNSILCQLMIHREKKGLQLQNIFPSQIKEFPVPDIDMQRQNAIAERITDEMDKQKAVDIEIEQKRKEIDGLVMRAIHLM